jgi:hypothetical protein
MKYVKFESLSHILLVMTIKKQIFIEMRGLSYIQSIALGDTILFLGWLVVFIIICLFFKLLVSSKHELQDQPAASEVTIMPLTIYQIASSTSFSKEFMF